MFSGKKSGLLVLTTYHIVLGVHTYIEQEVSVNESLITNLWEVLAKFNIIKDLCLQLLHGELTQPWYLHYLQLWVQ